MLRWQLAAGGEVIGVLPQALDRRDIAEWGWFRWDDLPPELFAPIRALRATGWSPSP
ncbi:hypothetical protein [Demequina muriae]|uniref:Uncharacterized protein n=1 Tax=Demequina muriae TaxID=3051664 RepID=A0ABT8GG60_9MICO|nr:hypothetical protein [Demequina sp. EGI L300058]MDN4480261.1 hypothetical protein [Demequina sp. EGI L300058]